MVEPVETWTVAIDADISKLQQELANATRIGRQFGATLTNAFNGIALRGRDLGDVPLSGISLSRMVKAAFRPLREVWRRSSPGAVRHNGLRKLA